jgi:diguanylate cyclase (GGDEF)-like protein
MGGDEYLIKPIKPDHLISTVTVLAERMKIIRSNMVKDSMTGLFNYAATKDALDAAIKQAQNQDQEETVCFAMIDLDHFKDINDNYGHDAGDRVLMALARLLRQRLRKADVVGRTGGEEFAVVLPACSIQEAGQLLQKILEDFATISFPAGRIPSIRHTVAVSPHLKSTTPRQNSTKQRMKRSIWQRVKAAIALLRSVTKRRTAVGILSECAVDDDGPDPCP